MMRLFIVAMLIFPALLQAQSLDATVVKNLNTGCNLVGFMGQTPEDTKEAFASMMDKVEMIKTLDGFYTPEIEAYLSSLPTVTPLDGVLIKVSATCILERTIKKSAILYYDNEEDPIFIGSAAADITVDDIANLGNLSGENSGDQNICRIVDQFGSNKFKSSATCKLKIF